MATTITIENCNICRISGPRKVLNKVYLQWRKPHPNRFYIITRGKSNWDGYINYVKEDGSFKIGLMPKVRETLIELGETVKIVDNRPKLRVKPKVPTELGGEPLYPRQIEGIHRLVSNQVDGTPFVICAGDYSVGFGKTRLFCALHKAYQFKLRTLVLLKEADLFDQFKREIPQLLPEEEVTFVRGGKVLEWSNFTVAMAPSVSQNMKKYQRNLAMVDMVLIDEADVLDNKTFQTVISGLWNSIIRIGLSGTLYMSELKEKQVHNLNIMQFIGPKADEVRLKNQMDDGKATPVVIKSVTAKMEKLPEFETYPEEYNGVIVDNPESYEIMMERIKFNASYNRFPMIIVTKFIPHCEMVYHWLKSELGDKYNIAYMHNEVKNRDKILSDTREGKVDILVSTLIIARGKNIPNLRYILNIASMKSQEQTIQVTGRLVRKFEGKNKGYIDDICFPGKYLSRHGRARVNHYLKEGLKVIKVEQSMTDREYVRKTKRKSKSTQSTGKSLLYNYKSK